MRLLQVRSLHALVLTLTLMLCGSSASAQLKSHVHRHSPANASRYLIDLTGSAPKKVRDVSAYLSAQGLDVAGVNYSQRKVEVILSEAEAQTFKQRFGARVTMTKLTETKKLDPRYLNPQSLEKRMRELAAQFPNQAKLHQIGQSNQGRPLLALELSNPGLTVKPNILVDGMHHAREIMTPEIALDVAETLLQAQRSARAPMWLRRASTDLMENARIWVVPMVNPDGNNIVWTENAWWRKNARADGRSIHGVDINRNYPFQWAKCNGSSGSPSNDTFRGAAAGSEPETQALIGLGDLIKPIIYLSYHSYSELVLAPYGCEGQYTSEQKLITHFGEKFARNLPRDRAPNGRYVYGTSWEVLYGVDGASVDYFFAAYGAMSYVIEVNEEFQPDYSLRAPTVQKHRNAWLALMTDVLGQTQTIRTMDAQGAPVEALIEFAEVQHKAGERPFQTNKQGILYKVLAPGTYRLRAKAANGRMAETTATISGSGVIELRL